MPGCAPASCSHTAEITKAATTVNQLATESKVKAQEIAASAASDAPDLPMIVQNASQIASSMSSIQSECNTISVHAGNVQDTQSQWVTLIEYVSAAVLIVGLCVLSWYWGAGALTRAIFKKLGWWVDSAEEKRKAELKLADEVRKGITDPKELIAVMRSDVKSDRLYKDIKNPATQ